MSFSSFPKITLDLKLDNYVFFYYGVAAMHVPNNQVNISSVVAFMKPFVYNISNH